MSKEMSFLVYCIEEYKAEKNLTGKEVMSLFRQYAVCEYLKSFYGALHTTGKKYIVEDIDLYIRSRA